MLIINKKLYLILYIVSSLCFSFLVSPREMLHICIFVVVGPIIAIALYILFNKKNWQDLFIPSNKSDMCVVFLIIFILGILQYEKWFHSSKLFSFAGLVKINFSIILILFTIIISFFSIFFCLQLIKIIIKLFNVLTSSLKTGTQQSIKYISLALLIVFLIFSQFNFCTISQNLCFYKVPFPKLLLNLFIIVCLIFVIETICRRWRLAFFITSSILFVYSLANFYVIKFHGSPLFFSEFKNAKTATNVLLGYHFSLDSELLIFLGIFALELIFIFKIPNDKQSWNWKKFLIKLASVIVCSLLIILCVLSKTLIAWSWDEGISKNGFFLCLIDDAKRMSKPYKIPDGYDDDVLSSLKSSSINVSINTYPDIILILNETFADISKFSTISTDKNYLEDFYSVPNTKYGTVVVPFEGGGTNNTEFELLTSDSSYLLNAPAPFNYVDFTNNGGIVKYLKSLGYVTTAMHSQTALNYSRQTAYPKLGFDNNYFIENYNFITGHNGNRGYLDADNYKDMISEYDENSVSPQLMYLLTIQNHGGYEQNDDSLDTVHVNEDLGNITNEVNECLSSIALSASAFKELISYYEKASRPVIICMLGDHMPPFIGSLPSIDTNNDIELEIASKTTPYALWSNYGVDFSSVSEEISVTNLIPNILRAANMPLSVYYQTILDLQDKVPVFLSSGRYKDVNKNTGTYDKNSIYYKDISLYLQMEYNALKGNPYLDNLFCVPK